MTGGLVISGAAVLLPEPPAEDGAPYRIGKLVPPEGFSAAALRKTSRVGRMALAVVAPAFQEAGLEASSELGLVAGTGLADIAETTGFLDGLSDRGPEYASPQNFQRSVHGAMAGEIAILYGLTGYSLTVTQGLHSGTAALYQAMVALEAGRCRRCLCVAADSLSPGVIDAHEALGGARILGEGAAALVLERRADASKILAEIEDIDLAGAERAGAAGIPGLGAHGAVELMQIVLAIRADDFSQLPAGVRLTR